MKTIALVLCLLSSCAFGQKMSVKVLNHTDNGIPYRRFVPGMIFGRSNATAYGNSASVSGSAVGMPAHEIEGVLKNIELLLKLPDGRTVKVSCTDHKKIGMDPNRIHFCKEPQTDELEANFSGAKVKLTWGVGIDGKKKESDTYMVGPVYPASDKP